MAEAKTATARGYDWPDEGELVVCTVSNVKNFGAFVTLDEYESKEGFIHIAEVSSGWIKYIRDHVREGQKLVSKDLKGSNEKRHTDRLPEPPAHDPHNRLPPPLTLPFPAPLAPLVPADRPQDAVAVPRPA